MSIDYEKCVKAVYPDAFLKTIGNIYAMVIYSYSLKDNIGGYERNGHLAWQSAYETLQRQGKIT